jgi:hypothetical protein
MNATMSLNSQKSKSSKSKSKHSSSSSSFTNSASIPVSHSKFNSCVVLISDPSDSTCRSKLASMIAHRGRGCPWNWIVPHLPTILASIPAHRSRALFAALCSRAESISLKSELSSVFSRDYAKDPFTAVALAQSLHAPLLRAHMDLLQDTFLRIGTSSSSSSTSSTSNTSNSSHSYSLEERNAAAVAYALLFRGASDVQKAFTTLLDECMRNIRSHMHSAFYKTVFRHLFVHASQRVLAIRIPIGRVLDFVLEKDVSDASLLWAVLAALGPRCMIRQSQITAFLLFRCPRSSTAWAAAMRLWLDLPGASSSIWGVLLETSSSSSSMSMSMSMSMSVSKKEYRLDAVLDLPTRLLTQLVQRAGRCIPESVLCAVEAMTLKRMAFCLLRPHHSNSSRQEDSNPHDDEKRMKMLVDDFGLVTTCLLSHEASVSPYTHLFLALAQKARHGGAGVTYGVRSAAQKAVAIVELLVHPRRPPVAIVPQIDLTVEVARMMERQHKRSLVEEMLLDTQGKQEEAAAAGQKEEQEKEKEAENRGHSRLQPHAQMQAVAQVEKERRLLEERKEEEAPLAKRPRVEVTSSFVQSSAPVVTPVSVVVTSTNTAIQIGDNAAAAADDEDEDDDMISLDSVDSIGSLGSLDDEA